MSTTSQTAQIHVMVVDDDITILKTANAMLGQANITCSLAASVNDALKLLKETPSIQLVLLDIRMPEHDGFEALGAIRSTAQFNAISVVMMTSIGQREMVTKSFLMGACDYILKPFSKETLIERVIGNLYISMTEKPLRMLLDRLTFEDPGIASSAGLKQIDKRTHKLYSVVFQERRICFSIESSHYPKVLAAGPMEEIKANVSVYLQMFQRWVPLWPKHAQEPMEQATTATGAPGDNVSIRFRRDFICTSGETPPQLPAFQLLSCTQTLVRHLIKASPHRDGAIEEIQSNKELFSITEDEAKALIA